MVINLVLIIVTGDLGSGKTLFLTYIAKNTKKRIYSNYKLYLNTYHKLTIKKLLELKEEENALVFIDEAYTWLESRASGRDTNQVLSYIYFQSRKRKLDFFLTAQLTHTIDRRFRELYDYVVHCEVKGAYFHYSIYDRYKLRGHFKLRVDLAEKYFPLYDTMEIIMTEKNIEMAWNALSRNEKIKQIEKIKKDFMKKIDEDTKITHQQVKYFLWKNKYPMSIEPFLYLEVSS